MGFWDDRKDYSEDEGGSGWGMLTPDPWEWAAIFGWVRRFFCVDPETREEGRVW